MEETIFFLKKNALKFKKRVERKNFASGKEEFCEWNGRNYFIFLHLLNKTYKKIKKY